MPSSMFGYRPVDGKGTKKWRLAIGGCLLIFIFAHLFFEKNSYVDNEYII
ncbi:hypothetical protein TF3313_1717 [Tannerella forsythia 3313]|nr:hypothetical protein TF3313_1717 [Tannerella forsythia 3313]